jgi:hypothetical protein
VDIFWDCRIGLGMSGEEVVWEKGIKAGNNDQDRENSWGNP